MAEQTIGVRLVDEHRAALDKIQWPLKATSRSDTIRKLIVAEEARQMQPDTPEDVDKMGRVAERYGLTMAKLVVALVDYADRKHPTLEIPAVVKINSAERTRRMVNGDPMEDAE